MKQSAEITWGRKSTKPSSPCQLCLTTRNVRPLRTPARLPALKDAHRQRADGGRLGMVSIRKRTRRVAVFDFGGGTFDISILKSAKASVK